MGILTSTDWMPVTTHLLCSEVTGLGDTDNGSFKYWGTACVPQMSFDFAIRSPATRYGSRHDRPCDGNLTLAKSIYHYGFGCLHRHKSVYCIYYQYIRSDCLSSGGFSPDCHRQNDRFYAKWYGSLFRDYQQQRTCICNTPVMTDVGDYLDGVNAEFSGDGDVDYASRVPALN